MQNCKRPDSPAHEIDDSKGASSVLLENSDGTMPQDIEKRFQHLVNQFLRFQRRAGFSESDKKLLINFGASEVEHTDTLEQAIISRKELVNTLPAHEVSGVSIQNAPDLDKTCVNSWNDLSQMLFDVDTQPILENNEQSTEGTSCSEKEEHLKRMEERLLEEQKRLSDMRNTLLKYEDAVSKREMNLEKTEQDITENERAVAQAFAEAHKLSAELSAQKSFLEEERQRVASLQLKLETETCDLQIEKDLLNQGKQHLHDQSMQLEAKVKDVEVQLAIYKKERDELKEYEEKLQCQRIADTKVKEEEGKRLLDKEVLLKNTEKELEEKCKNMDNLTRRLNAREKVLRNIQKQNEEEHLRITEAMSSIEEERKSLEEAKKDFEVSKRNLSEAWEHISSERREAAEYIQSANEKMKAWEDRLKQKEKELLQQQDFLKSFEAQVKNEKQNCHRLHSELQQEQERTANDLRILEENVKKREIVLERKEEEVKKSLQKLVEKRNLVDTKLKQLKEMEARTEGLEAELHKHRQEHLQKVERHAKEYQVEMAHLEKSMMGVRAKEEDVDRRLQEVRMAKKEIKLWQEEAEDALDNQAEALIKDKDELEFQKQNVRNLQHEIERAGAQAISYMMSLEQPCARIEELRHRLHSSQVKLQLLADQLSQQQMTMKERGKNLEVMERKLQEVQNEWEKKNMDLVAKNELLSMKEKALKSKEDNFICKEEFLELKEEAIKLREGKLKVLEAKFVEREGHQTSSEKDREHPPENTFKASRVGQWKQLSAIDFTTEEKHQQHKLENQVDASSLELFHFEAAKILKERENLKIQQHELEETKHAVQDAKLTLAAQLRATKEIVVDASMTAQKASREREALEQERKRLAQAQREIEVALKAREARLSLEEQKLEKDKCYLEEEREKALEIICKAEQMKIIIDGVDTRADWRDHLDGHDEATKSFFLHADSGSNRGHCVDLIHSPGVSCSNVSFNLDMINIWREEECAKIEREEKMIMDEISKLHNQKQQQSNTTPAEINDMSSGLGAPSIQRYNGAENDGSYSRHAEIGPMLEALQLPRQGTNSFFQTFADEPEPSDGLLSESDVGFTQSIPQEKISLERTEQSLSDFEQDVNSCQSRLETVMRSLVNARQASRSRFQRTRNLLQTLPFLGSPAVLEVQQSLAALSDRLRLMERMEDDLADELREAYKVGVSETSSEGMIVDKVELLCKMEEQQALRAEWEEQMQHQLEKISLLQANTQVSVSPSFNTPIKRTVFVSPRSNSSQSL